jgi:type III restriction enzyme
VDEDGSRRDLDYDSDVLSRVPWDAMQPTGWVAQWAPDVRPRGAAHMSLGLELLDGSPGDAPLAVDSPLTLERARIVRSVADLAPNPWLAWAWLRCVEAALEARGVGEPALAGSAVSLIDALRVGIVADRDRLAEAVFATLLAQGRIEFRLRADLADYELPGAFDQMISGAAVRWTRDADGQEMQRTLFEPALRAGDINEFEHRVAGWLDEQQAVRWWHRNVARTQFGLQGWKRDKVHPDFVFAMDAAEGPTRIVLLETKGLHLANQDTAYKRALLDSLSKAFRDERWKKVGELGLAGGSAEDVLCDLVFDKAAWQGELNQRHFNPS